MTTKLPAVPNKNLPPPVLGGNVTGAVRRRVEDLLFSLASCFEIWVTRRQSLRILATIKVVHAFRDDLVTRDAAPKTLNRRISSVSSFYKHLGAAAGELRLPITVPNPAHAQFIARQSTSPGREQGPLGNPGAPGHGHACRPQCSRIPRSRAPDIFLYSGARLSTACQLKVSDFHQDGD